MSAVCLSPCFFTSEETTFLVPGDEELQDGIYASYLGYLSVPKRRMPNMQWCPLLPHPVQTLLVKKSISMICSCRPCRLHFRALRGVYPEHRHHGTILYMTVS